MRQVEWHGPPPSRALARTLEAAGFEAARPGGAAQAVAVVRCTGSGRRVPTADPDGAAWIWLCHGDLSEAQRTEAVARGAYDAISLRDPRAADELVARLGELAVPLPVPPRES